MNKSSITFAVLGFATGIAFIVGCPDGTLDSSSGATTMGMGTASADTADTPSECTQREFTAQETGTNAPNGDSIPAGWEPFAWNGDDSPGYRTLGLRRCLD